MTATTTKRSHFADLRENPGRSAWQRRLEQRHLYSSLFTLPVVEKLASDETSGVVSLDLFKTISVHCRFIGREADGISNVLSEELFKYSEQYGGIVVAFGNSSLATGSAPSFEHDLRWIFHKIQTTVYVFKPTVGSVLRGIVNSRSSPNFIGCLIHTVFNAAVWIDEEERGIHGEIADGDEIDIQVTNVFYTSDTVTINGTLVGSQRRLITTEKEINSRQITEDDNLDDSGEIESANSPVTSSVPLQQPSSTPIEPEKQQSLYSAISDQYTAAPTSTPSLVEGESQTKKKKKSKSGDLSADNETTSIDREKLKKKKKKKKKDRNECSLLDASSQSSTSTFLADSTVDLIDVSKHKKKKKKKKEKDSGECGDAIPELVLEKKLKRESEGSSNGNEAAEETAAKVTVFDDDDDDFEPPTKKKRKKSSV